jgi:hypothetical protein
MRLTDNGKVYAWRQLTERAGLTDLDAITFNYGDPAVAPAGEGVVTVIPCDRRAGEALLQLPPRSIDWLPVAKVLPTGASLPFCDPVPVPFWGERSRGSSPEFAESVSRQHVVFHVDIIAATFFMLTRWEEAVTPVRDEHDRFPATASVAYRQGFLSRPIIDEYALILRAWLQMLLPDWQPRREHFSVEISHDVDHVRRFRHLGNALRTVASSLWKHQAPRAAIRAGTQAAREAIRPRRAAHYRQIYALADQLLAHERGGTFYFMASPPGPLDNEYSVAARHVQDCIRQLLDWGFNIGLHPSYHSFNKPARLRQEKSCLNRILPRSYVLDGARQHYLRFAVPDTWRHYCEAGFRYSANMCYHDHEGFRCGTCHPFSAFDFERDRVLPVTEHPLIIMDRTLQNYRCLTPKQSLEQICDYALRCQQVEGCFSLLWHNGHRDPDWLPTASLYTEALTYLSSFEAPKGLGQRVIDGA